MGHPVSALRVFATEIGLVTLIKSPRDTKILCFQRLVRFTAYGVTTLILALFLTALRISEEHIGLFMTLTLLGDVAISLVLTVIADGIGRRRMLAFGASLMVISGVVFATCDNFWILVLASVLGVISPSGNEIGPFRAIEESTIAHLTEREERTAILSWYTIFGYAGSSLGVLMCGWIVRFLQQSAHWTKLESYRLVFWMYAGLGLVKMMLCFLLTERCEPREVPRPGSRPNGSSLPVEDETRPLLVDETQQGVPASGNVKKGERGSELLMTRLLPKMSKESASVVWKLCCLFAIDSLASGLTPASWMTWFFEQKFHLSEGALGTLFFVTSILSATSMFAAAPLARRIGLIKTMVFTHVPASVALALIPLPSNVYLAMGLLAFRGSTNAMDQAPRQAFIAAAVLPEERTAVMGAVNVVKTLSQSAGPAITGALAQRSRIWISFVLAGSLKLMYDFLMLAMFVGYRTVEEVAEEQLVNEGSGGDENEANGTAGGR